MSDQPKPTTGGMSHDEIWDVMHGVTKPKPTGEWTVAYDNMVYAGDPRDSNNFLAIIRDDEGRNRIVDAHNAQIAAVEIRFGKKFDQLIQDYEQQLAAEREKLTPLVDYLIDGKIGSSDDVTVNNILLHIQQLREQLAAERDAKEYAISGGHAIAERLRVAVKELAAERGLFEYRVTQQT